MSSSSLCLLLQHRPLTSIQRVSGRAVLEQDIADLVGGGQRDAVTPNAGQAAHSEIVGAGVDGDLIPREARLSVNVGFMACGLLSTLTQSSPLKMYELSMILLVMPMSNACRNQPIRLGRITRTSKRTSVLNGNTLGVFERGSAGSRLDEHVRLQPSHSWRPGLCCLGKEWRQVMWSHSKPLTHGRHCCCP